jgi:hypothetical protein
VLGIVVGIVVGFVVIVAPAYHVLSREPSESFTLTVSPKSLSVARGGFGTLMVTFSPPEYGSRLSPSMVMENSDYWAEGFGEIDGFSSPINQNSFAYNFGIENNVPPGTYTVTLTVVTHVPSPPLTVSENIMLTVT